MNHYLVRILFAVIFPLSALVANGLLATTPSALSSQGYSVFPSPQEVNLGDNEVNVNQAWGVVCQAGNDHIALKRLVQGAGKLHGLTFAGEGQGKIVLRISPGTVKVGPEAGAVEQAYKIVIRQDSVTITGNAGPGLLYGVQTFLQLLKPSPGQGWTVPEGTISDWPRLELRFVHWDTKHHQNRMETLKRYIDWAAYFKVNAIGFELEDKFEYPSHPVIGAPGAYTKAQMQELTRYALERYIQLIPQIQSPAHMAYVLKHDEFARFRSDDNNYQICLCDEEALRLVFDMYEDMIEATPGVEYFHVSTDEVYYAGICDKCRKIRPFNDENRSLSWVEFVNRAFDWLSARNRKMLCWVEYPLLKEHIHLLPGGLINGVTHANRSDSWNEDMEKQGVDQLVYSSQQGSELLVPNYFPSNVTYRGNPIGGRLSEPGETVRDLLGRGVKVIGTYAAAWDDSGLHDELFWLGWATVSQYGWSPQGPSAEQSTADFMNIFYGAGNQDMVEAYRTLMEGARYYENALDRVPATRLKPSYGSYARKGRDTTRIDFTLEPPQLPFSYDMTLVIEDNFSRKYAKELESAPEMLIRLDMLIHFLHGKLGSVERNRYNIEVMLSIARFEQHFCRMLLDLQETEKLLQNASRLLDQEREPEVVDFMVRAHSKVAGILADRAGMWTDLNKIWEKSRYEKGRDFGGRKFVHVLDDLKDHRADRRAGLEYMLEPLENIGLESWNDRLAEFIRGFALGTGLEPPDLLK
ncbi:beta-N-acetylhexosaminidase [Gemmatimonadota bacterium]